MQAYLLFKDGDPVNAKYEVWIPVVKKVIRRGVKKSLTDKMSRGIM